MAAFVTIESLRNACESEKYHSHFLTAILGSVAAAQNNRALPCRDHWIFPAIEFTTEDWTRRSMTLNGMRMSTEYFASGSTRVLTLVEQRLEAGQSDVVHDVLVYLWERILQFRAQAQEARALQAESLAAYLGLAPISVTELFRQGELSNVAAMIESGAAGTPRRALEIAPLVENLLARLQPELTQLQRHEDQVLQLIDEVAIRLYRIDG